MNYKIEMLNFLYLYRYCQECHMDVSTYENEDIEDISSEDISNILFYILYKENISTSYSECRFSDKIEKYINQSDTENLSMLGTALGKKVQTIEKFKSYVNNMLNNTASKEFIDDFNELVISFREIKNDINNLSRAKEVVKQNGNDTGKNNKLINLVF